MSDSLDGRLKDLSQLAVPAPGKTARQRALNAAMEAFDADGPRRVSATKGLGWPERLKSIVHHAKGSWIMDTRVSIGMGTAALALLLLPLGYQLYLTASSPPAAMGNGLAAGPVVPGESDGSSADSRERRGEVDLRTGADLAREAAPLASATAAPETSPTAPMSYGDGAAHKAGAAASAGPSDASAGWHGLEIRGDRFESVEESAVRLVGEHPVSTFSVDVDTASYAYLRRLLNEGYLPPAEAVRVEEMINYFSYGYAPPDSAGTPFAASIAVFPTPWNAGTELVRIGIKGFEPPAGERPPANLVLLIDTSGSMDGPDRLPLVQRAFALLVDQLGPRDTVSIVTYAGAAGVALRPTKATEKSAILAALDRLQPGGSTAGAQGIELAYQLARENLVANGINRVILATDGDFNIGISDPRALEAFIRNRRDEGVSLSVVGVGQGNYTDTTMQALAQNGNGNAFYLDSFREARKVLAAELGGTLQTIAQDVKVQVEFNPAVVAEYRLIGYETRALAREDFNNDRVDAGDIGAGHTVTALYEIIRVGSDAALVDALRYGAAAPNEASSDEIGFVKVRYKLPGESTSRLIETPISQDLRVEGAAVDGDARWATAVAAFGQKLRGSSYGGELSYAEIRRLAQGARGEDAEGYRAEFIQLVEAARLASGEE